MKHDVARWASDTMLYRATVGHGQALRQPQGDAAPTGVKGVTRKSGIRQEWRGVQKRRFGEPDMLTPSGGCRTRSFVFKCIPPEKYYSGK